MKRYCQKIEFDCRSTRSQAQMMLEVIMNTFQVIYEGRSLCMYVIPNPFCNDKGYHLEVCVVGETELCDKFFKAISHTFQMSLKSKDTFEPTKGWKKEAKYILSDIIIENN